MATPDDIQPDVRSFIADNIHSVAQLELLLLFQADPAKAWTASEAAIKLCTAADMTSGLLDELRGLGLLSAAEGSEVRFSYQPRTPQLAKIVDDLAQLYQQRRVTVITMIYSQPVDKLRSFADAFRFRRDKKDP